MFEILLQIPGERAGLAHSPPCFDEPEMWRNDFQRSPRIPDFHRCSRNRAPRKAVRPALDSALRAENTALCIRHVGERKKRGKNAMPKRDRITCLERPALGMAACFWWPGKRAEAGGRGWRPVRSTTLQQRPRDNLARIDPYDQHGTSRP